MRQYALAQWVGTIFLTKSMLKWCTETEKEKKPPDSASSYIPSVFQHQTSRPISFSFEQLCLEVDRPAFQDAFPSPAVQVGRLLPDQKVTQEHLCSYLAVILIDNSSAALTLTGHKFLK